MEGRQLKKVKNITKESLISKGRIDKLKSPDLQAQVGVECHTPEHKNPQ